MTAISPEAYALECGNEPSLSSISGDTRASVTIFRRFLLENVGREIDFVGIVGAAFASHPQADQQLAASYMRYYGCKFLNDLLRDNRITEERQRDLNNDLTIATSSVGASEKPVAKTPLPSEGRFITTPANRQPIGPIGPTWPHHGEIVVPSKFKIAFNPAGMSSRTASWELAENAGSHAALSAPETGHAASLVDKYLRPAPIVLLENNSYWVVVAAAQTEADGESLIRSMKDRFPTYDFALYGPTKTQPLYGIMMATWVSRQEAMDILPKAQEINSNAFIWKAEKERKGKPLLPPLTESLLLPVPEVPGVLPPHEGGFWERDVLTGDWGGRRSALEDKGIVLDADTIDETLGNPSGGTRQGAIYDGRLELAATVDLGKTLGWTGATFHVNGYQIHGRGLTANNLHNLFVVSNIEADRSTRLFDLWVEQSLLGSTLSVRLGQIAADDEFLISSTGASFINLTFGWPGLAGADLPAGGPSYPLTTPGVRVKYAATEALTFASAVFNGNPAGPTTSGNQNPDPQLRDPSGTAFNVNSDVFAIFEASYNVNQNPNPSGLPASYKLGAWYHSGKFADQHVDTEGISLASPGSNGIPRTHVNNFSLYGIVDQTIWQDPETTSSIAGFLRAMAAPADRNLVSFYADAGLAFSGPLEGRSNDVAGIAFAYGAISPDRQELDRDFSSLAGSPRPVQDYEAVLELTYSAQLSPWWRLQPDVQYVIHPGGYIQNPVTGRGAIGSALVFGLRSAIVF
jgi:porin